MLVKNRGYIRKLRVRKEAPSPKKPVQSQKSAGSQKKVKLIVPDKEKGTDKATASNSQADDKPKGIFMKTHVPRKYMPHVAPVYTKRVVHFSREAHDCREHLIDKAASSKRFGIYQEFTSEWNKETSCQCIQKQSADFFGSRFYSTFNSNENDEGENKQKCGILETILGSPDKSGGKSPIKPFASRIISLFTGL